MEYKGIKWNMSIVLFWACPQKFIPLDSVTRNLLKAKHNLTINDEMLSSAKYLGIIGQVKTLFEQPDSPYKSFAEMSDNAFTYASEQQRFWIAGTSFGEPRKNQIDKFVKEGYWEGGECDTEKYIKLVKSGDVLIAATSSTKGSNHDQPFLRVYGVGIVTSDMQVPDPARPRWFKCDVDWIRISPEVDFDGNKYGKYRKTLQECAENLLDLKNFALEKLEMGQIEPRMDEMDKCQEYVKLLEANHNIILHGAPGTGKTYLAKKIAKAMGCSETEIGFVQFHQSYDYTDFVEGLRPAKGESDQINGFIRQDGIFKLFCKKAINDGFTGNFKESLKELIQKIQENADEGLMISSKSGKTFYLNFLEGTTLRFTTQKRRDERKDDGFPYTISLENLENLYYNRDLEPYNKVYANAVIDFMMQTCHLQPAKTKNHNVFVFIIDEINRGEMSKIFGELFFSIDPGYRGVAGKVRTQYANMLNSPNIFDDVCEENESFGHFFVPENVYIIGTMNDIDRSVESMDFAMRRRFAFKEIKASDRIEMLKDAENGIGVYAEDAKKRMNALNDAIEKIPRLSSAYHIGPAYFLKLKNYMDESSPFDSLWKYHIEGIIKEYLRGIDPDGTHFGALKKAYEGKVQTENLTENAEV